MLLTGSLIEVIQKEGMLPYEILKNVLVNKQFKE